MSALIATTNDNVFTLLSKQNKFLGGTGATTNDNEFTLLSKNNVLLGGSKASASDTVFTLLSKQNKLLGGPGASTADRAFNLLSRQNKLLGGPGANTNDNIFTLLAKNNALFQIPAGPPATVLQTATGVWTSGKTIAATFPSTSKSGNTILVHSTANDGTVSVAVSSIVISGSGNSGAFSNIISQPGTNLIGVASADAAPNIVASPTNPVTVTVTFTAGTITTGSITIHELANMPSALALDGAPQSARATVGGTTATAGPITTTGNNTVIFAFVAPQATKHCTAGSGGGWTATILTGAGQGCDEWQAFTSGQSGLSVGFAMPSSAVWNWAMFGLKGAAR